MSIEFIGHTGYRNRSEAIPASGASIETWPAEILDGGNSTSLVGNPDHEANAVPDNRGVGMSTFLIRGVDRLQSALLYGRDLLSRIHALVEQERRMAAAA